MLRPKRNIKSLLNNAVDMHNHILPGIDDGAVDLETSLLLVKEYKNLGYSKIIATPHTMHDYYPNTSEIILKALDTLNQGLKQHNIQGVEVKAASEYMIDPEFEEVIDSKGKLLTFEGNYILVEMSYLQESDNLKGVLYKLQLQGYKPILAHPERYSFYLGDFKKYYILKKQGVKFQLNMLALSDHYGNKIQKTAKRLLKEGMYDFIGIDTHRVEHLRKVENLKLSKKNLERVEQLLKNNGKLF